MRPRLTPAIADVRRAVREALAGFGEFGVSGVSGVPGVPGVPGVADTGAIRVRMRPHAANAPGRRGAIAAGGRKHDGGALVVPGSVADVLVALSGGTDSLALAAATAFEAPRAGLRAGAVIVDHGLQTGSADVAERAAAQARELGLDPVLVRRVEVGTDGGPEAAAREARYAALAEAASETGASAVFLGHTLDDQAETVLLGLARGSGAASLSGMAPVTFSGRDGYLRPPPTNAPARAGANESAGRNRDAVGSAGGRPSESAPGSGRGVEGSVSGRPSESNGRNRSGGSSGGSSVDASADTQLVYVRPLLGIRRATTVQFCVDSGLEPWHDPQNADPKFARVRVRETLLPLLERELGPGIAEALARTADQTREDSEALDHFAEEQAEELAEHAEAGLSLSVKGLEHNPAALRQRIIRLAVASEFGVSLSRAQTLEVARLVTDWHGQGELHLPGIRVVRQGGLIVFSAAEGGAQARG